MVGRRPRASLRERAAVRQRLVAANHQARECNAPDQSMFDACDSDVAPGARGVSRRAPRQSERPWRPK